MIDPRRQRLAPALLLLAVPCVTSACAVVLLPADPPRYDPSHEPRLAPVSASVSVDAGVDAGAIDALAAETARVLASPQFQANLQAAGRLYGELWLAPGGQRIAADELLSMIRGSPGPYATVPTTITVGRARGQNASTGIAADGGSATIMLDPRVIAWWNDDRTKGDAVNTLAHERTHTIPVHEGSGKQAVEDRGVHWASFWELPLASYMVGGVAQCTYLQVPESELRACLQKHGFFEARD